MATLNSQPIRMASLPGSNLVVGMWVIEAASASDTFKVPALLTRSASTDQSSLRVLDPATGVTVNAAAIDADGNHTVTLAAAAPGQRVTVLSLHPQGRLPNS